jgi:hypothetical protein
MTVVEVLIAVVLLMAVVSSAALAIVGSSSVQHASKAAVRAETTVEQVLERVNSATGWAEACMTLEVMQSGCDLLDEGLVVQSTTMTKKQNNPSVNANSNAIKKKVTKNQTSNTAFIDVTDLLEDDLLDVTWKVAAWAFPVDSPDDGLIDGPTGDRDGIFPDYWEIVVQLGFEDEKDAAARYPGLKPIEVVRVADSKGMLGVGTLVVEACSAINQADERINVEGCTPQTRWVPIAPCDGAASTCPSWAAAAGKPPSPTEASQFMGLARSTASFTLQSADGTSKFTQADAQTDPAQPGVWTFSSIPSGTYSIAVTGGPAGMTAWSSHMRPANGEVTVQPRSRTNALLAFKPAATGQVTFDLYRNVSYLEWKTASHTESYPDAGCGDGYKVDPSQPGGEAYLADGYTGGTWRSCRSLTRIATMYYFRPQVTGPEEWGGSGANITWSTKPDPTGRLFKSTTNGKKTEYSDLVVSTNADSRRGSPSATHTETLGPMEPGLWKPIVAGTTASGVTYSGLVGELLWVSPTGTANGTTNPKIKVSTPGECYVSLPGTSVDDQSYTSGKVIIDGNKITQAGYTEKMADTCSTSGLVWKGKLYTKDGAVTWAYQFCGRTVGEYWDEKWSPVYSPVTDDPVTGEETTSQEISGYEWKRMMGNSVDYTRCWGYDPPLACTDDPAMTCGPAVLYVPSPPGTKIPPRATNFKGVDFKV